MDESNPVETTPPIETPASSEDPAPTEAPIESEAEATAEQEEPKKLSSFSALIEGGKEILEEIKGNLGNAYEKLSEGELRAIKNLARMGAKMALYRVLGKRFPVRTARHVEAQLASVLVIGQEELRKAFNSAVESAGKLIGKLALSAVA